VIKKSEGRPALGMAGLNVPGIVLFMRMSSGK
jgi:hypothetical protein